MVATAQREVKPTIHVAGQVTTVDAWQRAVERARTEDVRVYQHNGTWLASSVGEPGTLHSVNGHCDCKGAQRGLMCKHTAAVTLAKLGQGILAQCEHCGLIGQAGQDVITTLEHVGGHAGYVAITACRNQVECWRRWDRNHGLKS